jgi:hypothetical protein
MHDLHCSLEDEHVLSGIFHQIFAQPVDEKANIDGLVCGGVCGRNGNFMGSLRRE